MTTAADPWAGVGARAETIAGNEPVLLDGPRARVHQVEAGSLAVFAARYEDGVAKGSRCFLFRVSSGRAVFVAGGSGASDWRLLFVPVHETRLRSVDVQTAWSRADLRERVARLADGWIAELGRVVSPGALPKPLLRLEPGHELLLDEGDVVAAARDAVLWPRIAKGGAWVAGRPEQVVDPSTRAWPLGPGVWLEAEVPTLVVAEQTAEVDADRLSDGIASLHDSICAALDAREEAENQEELVRLLERDLVDADAEEAVLGDLAHALGGPRRGRAMGETPLLAAMGEIGRSLGVPIRTPRGDEPRGGVNALAAIARASRVRVRQVRLGGSWWRHDCGPLLAFAADEDARPVALLPRSSGGYDCFEPSEGVRTRVDRALASTLTPEAHAFYRPLPSDVTAPSHLFRFSLHGRGRDLALVVLAGAIVTFLGMVTPQVTALLMDQALPDANRRLLYELGAGLAAAALGRLAFELSRGIVLLRVSIASEAESQAAVWDRLLRLRPSFFRRYSSGDLQSRVAAVNEVGRELSGAMLTSLFSSVLALLNFGLLWVYSPRLSVVALALGVVVAAITGAANLLAHGNLRRLVEADGQFFGFVVQLVGGVAKLRVAGAAGRAHTQWVGRYGEILSLLARVLRLRQVVSVSNHALPLVSSALLFAFAYAELEEARAAGSPDGLSLGTFLAFNLAFATFLGGVTSLSETAVGLLDVVAKARRVQPILAAEPEVDESKADPGALSGHIAFESVDFRYRDDGALTLSGVSLHAEPGEFVAIVGPSGSGKSTILRLLLGFERPLAGEVQYDGQALANLDVLAVRRQLGVILQNGRLDAGSIYDNIASGNPITLDRAWAAAEDAGLADEIRAMPMGMHTIISVGGGNLSGGQRQRLLIARALAHRPRVLVFDEATSALDNRTQRVVSESLERLRVTRVVVAHRLSTIRNADRIYVVDGGRVVQAGGFDELMGAERGLFARMMARQMA